MPSDQEFQIVGTCTANSDIKFSVPVTISPLRVTASIKCKYDDKEIPTNWILEAGSKVEKLTYVILDENQQEMELVRSMFFNNSYIAESWNPNRRKTKKR